MSGPITIQLNETCTGIKEPRSSLAFAKAIEVKVESGFAGQENLFHCAGEAITGLFVAALLGCFDLDQGPSSLKAALVIFEIDLRASRSHSGPKPC